MTTQITQIISESAVTSSTINTPLVVVNENKQLNLNDEQKIIKSLIDDIEHLKKEIHDIKSDSIVKNLNLSKEMIEKVNISQPPRRLKRGMGTRPLLESEILEAQQHSHSALSAAEYLGVSYITYRKSALRYGIYKKCTIWKPRPIGKYNPNLGKFPLNEILEGKHPNYPIFRLKIRIIRSGIKKPECEVCGFNEHRIGDNKMPLILNFEDGDSTNHKLENIKLLCYNCTFLCGRGYIHRGKFWFDDPDRMQGSKNTVEASF